MKSDSRREQRPLRLPPQVPIGTVEPPCMAAGETGTYKLRFVVPEDIVSEALVLWTGGHRWVKTDLLIQNEDPSAENYVSARIVGGDALEPLPRGTPEKVHELMRVSFKIPESGITKGSEIEIVLGDTSGESPGLSGPRFRMDNLFIPLTLEPRPQDLPGNELNWLGAFLVDFVGGPLDHLKVLAPSQVEGGRTFSLTIRPQDRLGNISPERPDSIELTLGDEKITKDIEDSDLNPAGAIEISGLETEEEGVLRIEAYDPGTGCRAASNPISVGPIDDRLLWGVIHEHTELSDGLGTPHQCYTNMRFGSRLDFGATSDHDHVFETSDEMWQMTKQATSAHNDPGSFVTFLGYEWAKWRRNGDGDRNVYYPGDEGEMYRSETGQFDSPRKLFKKLQGKECLIIPHHTAYEGNFCDWSEHEPEKERLVEIYSVWGSSEMSAARDNPLPIRNPRDYNPAWIRVSGEKPSLGEEPVGFVQNALAMGWRVGFTAGGDMHRSHPGNDLRQGYPPYEYTPGITGLWSSERTRESVYSGLRSRRCYATTGARMILRFTVNGYVIGSEISLPPGTAREIGLLAHCTDRVQAIELVRNNQVIRRETGLDLDVELDWVDGDDFRDVSLPANRWSSYPYIFYYVRLRQEDGEMAWTSPVWIEEGRDL